MNTTTLETTIETPQKLVARYGITAQLVSDNGSQFTSEVFQQFLTKNGIKHITSGPYHPATNRLAECGEERNRSEILETKVGKFFAGA